MLRDALPRPVRLIRCLGCLGPEVSLKPGLFHGLTPLVCHGHQHRYARRPGQATFTPPGPPSARRRCSCGDTAEKIRHSSLTREGLLNAMRSRFVRTVTPVVIAIMRIVVSQAAAAACVLLAQSDSPPTVAKHHRWPHSSHQHAACPLHYSHSTSRHRQHYHTRQPDHQPQSRCRRSPHHHTPRTTRCSPRCCHRHSLPHRRSGRHCVHRPRSQLHCHRPCCMRSPIHGGPNVGTPP